MAKPVSTALDESCCGGNRCEVCLKVTVGPEPPTLVSAGGVCDGLKRKLLGCCCGWDGLKPVSNCCWVTTWPLGSRTVWKLPGCCCCWVWGVPGGGRPNGLNRVVNWLKPLTNGWKNVPAKKNK